MKVELELVVQQYEKAKVIQDEQLERLTQICQEQGVTVGTAGSVWFCLGLGVLVVPKATGALRWGGGCLQGPARLTRPPHQAHGTHSTLQPVPVEPAAQP